MQVDLKSAVDWFIGCVGRYRDEEFFKSLSEIALGFLIVCHFDCCSSWS